ncbi:AIM36 Altered inheritance of mitochondria protein 36 [Candida maltosa Xu316]|uniref:Putative mitochondrial protein Fmp39 n=1 Tax=Candida maltosa (strain Xu316) TaxID=1245528 RepID=M3HST9_CANMX|nr:putative mitochondrial protein Fmp39 [Candida maltosa Xu316]
MLSRSLTNLLSRRLVSVKSTRITPSIFNQTPVQIFRRNYSIANVKKKKEPVMRYLIYMVVISWVAMYFAAGKVDKKKPNIQNLTEREFQQYEEETGLRRRNKLINHEMNSKYKFYVIPYVHDNDLLDKVIGLLKHEGKNVKVIDPVELIQQQKEDEGMKYHYLLEDLDEQRKPYPPGLITAIIKQAVHQFLNTREGTFDTNIIIKNYPQTTNEAIKFENDVSDIQKCLVLHYDMLNELPKHKTDEEQRAIKNVDGYFDSVGKSKTLVEKFDPMDAEFEEIILEDL